MENKKVKCNRYLFSCTLSLQKRYRQGNVGIIIVGLRTLSSSRNYTIAPKCSNFYLL